VKAHCNRNHRSSLHLTDLQAAGIKKIAIEQRFAYFFFDGSVIGFCVTSSISDQS
jgi:hypothetical protein